MIADDVKVDDFEVYRSGPGLRLLHAPCNSTFALGTRIDQRHLLEMEAAHQKTCQAKS
jgi:hypothetical protein